MSRVWHERSFHSVWVSKPRFSEEFPCCFVRWRCVRRDHASDVGPWSSNWGDKWSLRKNTRFLHEFAFPFLESRQCRRATWRRWCLFLKTSYLHYSGESKQFCSGLLSCPFFRIVHLENYCVSTLDLDSRKSRKRRCWTWLLTAMGGRRFSTMLPKQRIFRNCRISSSTTRNCNENYWWIRKVFLSLLMDPESVFSKRLIWWIVKLKWLTSIDWLIDWLNGMGSDHSPIGLKGLTYSWVLASTCLNRNEKGAFLTPCTDFTTREIH